MADYLTSSSVSDWLGASVAIQLTDDAGAGAINATVMTAAIAAAEADVNARLYKGFQGPITVVDHGQRAFDSVVQLCLRVVRYHLFSRRPHLMDTAGWIYADYEAALKSVAEMAKGGQALAGIPPVPRSSPETPTVTASNAENTAVPPRVWGRDATGMS